MLSDILAMISMGQKLLRTLADLRKDTKSLPATVAQPDLHSTRIEAIENRLNDLEILAKEQDNRLTGLENVLRDAIKATEALADRVATIFWIALAGCVLAAIAAILSLLFLTRVIR
jgi:hypothetical protein